MARSFVLVDQTLVDQRIDDRGGFAVSLRRNLFAAPRDGIDSLADSGARSRAQRNVAGAVLDGLSATRNIRDLERRRGDAPIPIIVLSANAMTHQVAESLQAGADAHISKPIDAAALLSGPLRRALWVMNRHAGQRMLARRP